LFNPKPSFVADPRPSKPQVREYGGGRVLFPSFGSSHVWPRRWSRRIAYYKRVALIEGTNIVRRELGLPEANVRAAQGCVSRRQAG
jgi:hypothetical protein